MSPREDFMLARGIYLLNHSVGPPLKTTESHFKQAFLTPWQDSNTEPWPTWLDSVEHFTHALSQLFNGQSEDFCPQVNLSGALTKLVMSLPRLQRDSTVILMSENDFPSMRYALERAIMPSSEIRFIPSELDTTNANVWEAHITSDVDLVFASHAYSNTGAIAPLASIIELAKAQGALTLVDAAQSAGIVPINLSALNPDFLIGSSVKWLCGGPGAAYLWVHPDLVDDCRPRDVGWFSHEDPFEFDIHSFRERPKALKFWGGTPSVAPFVIAANSIDYFASHGSNKLREHNQRLIDKIVAAFEVDLISPLDTEKRSGTAVLHFQGRQQQAIESLKRANISVDSRTQGIRISPHIYNSEEDIEHLINCIKSELIS
jgi:kynureninase